MELAIDFGMIGTGGICDFYDSGEFSDEGKCVSGIRNDSILNCAATIGSSHTDFTCGRSAILMPDVGTDTGNDKNQYRKEFFECSHIWIR